MLTLTDEQDSEKPFWIDRWSTSLNVERFRLLMNEIEAHVAIYRARKMILGHMIFDSKIAEKGLCSALLTHHVERVSETNIAMMRQTPAELNEKLARNDRAVVSFSKAAHRCDSGRGQRSIVGITLGPH